jgi:hypothetical protein
MALFGGSKKDDGLESLKPTARDVVRAIAKEEAEDYHYKKTVDKLEVKEMIKDEIRKDNVYEELKAKDNKIAILEKKIEELQGKSGVPRP